MRLSWNKTKVCLCHRNIEPFIYRCKLRWYLNIYVFKIQTWARSSLFKRTLHTKWQQPRGERNLDKCVWCCGNQLFQNSPDQQVTWCWPGADLINIYVFGKLQSIIAAEAQGESSGLMKIIIFLWRDRIQLHAILHVLFSFFIFLICGCNVVLTYTIVFAAVDLRCNLKAASNKCVDLWRIGDTCGKKHLLQRYRNQLE